jgi:hypothetical protein
MKQSFIQDKTATLRLSVYQNNRPVIPSAATVTIYKPAGSELQAEASATVDGTTGDMTYSLTTTHTADRGLNYKAVWSYTVSGVVYYETQLFDVVRSILSIPLTDDDLYAELESLRKSNAQRAGTATSASSSTLVDTARLKDSDDFWKGGTIDILSGTGSGQRRVVSGFTQSSSTVNVTPNWATTPDSTSTYRIVRSFTEKIVQSFEELEQMLYNKGNRQDLILESSQIKVVLLFLTLEKICRDLSDDVDDKWDRLATVYMEKFDKSFNALKLDYDADDSGTIDAEESASSINSLRIYRG